MISPSEAKCRYCGGGWSAEKCRMVHAAGCFILTGEFKVLGRKKRAEAEPVKPLDLSGDA